MKINTGAKNYKFGSDIDYKHIYLHLVHKLGLVNCKYKNGGKGK